MVRALSLGLARMLSCLRIFALTKRKFQLFHTHLLFNIFLFTDSIHVASNVLALSVLGNCFVNSCFKWDKTFPLLLFRVCSTNNKKNCSLYCITSYFSPSYDLLWLLGVHCLIPYSFHWTICSVSPSIWTPLITVSHLFSPARQNVEKFWLLIFLLFLSLLSSSSMLEDFIGQIHILIAQVSCSLI